MLRALLDGMAPSRSRLMGARGSRCHSPSIWFGPGEMGLVVSWMVGFGLLSILRKRETAEGRHVFDNDGDGDMSVTYLKWHIFCVSLF